MPASSSSRKGKQNAQTLIDDETSANVRDDIIKSNVGYGRPPEQTRFQKGRSGNPSGRKAAAAPDIPIDLQESKRDFLSHMDSVIPVRENGEIVKMTVRQANVRAIVATALKGGQRAQAEILYRDERLTRERALEIERENNFWKNVYCATAYAKIAEAKATGKPVPKFVPHPDDIMFEAGKPPQIIGPWDEESERKVLETRRYVEQLLLQHELDERLLRRKSTKSIFDITGAAYALAVIINLGLPPSLRLTDKDIAFRFESFRRIPTRELTTMVYKGWRKLGKHLKRGKTSPPAAGALKWHKVIRDALEEIQREASNDTPR